MVLTVLTVGADGGGEHGHVAAKASAEAPAKAYAVFFAVPDGEPAIQHVAPVTC